MDFSFDEVAKEKQKPKKRKNEKHKVHWFLLYFPDIYEYLLYATGYWQ